MTKKETTVDKLYQDDLAHIHVDGYGFHWEGAASVILRWLREHGIDKGLLVDLGCGGGQWLARADQDGYQTVGIDVSLSMIRQAKQNSPNTRFVCASFADADIPDCDAVTSLGEPLNYLNSGRLMRRTIKNVFEALRKDGLFIFDVRHPPLGQVDTFDHVKSDRDWFCHARIEEDANHLVRHIQHSAEAVRNSGENRKPTDSNCSRNLKCWNGSARQGFVPAPSAATVTTSLENGSPFSCAVSHRRGIAAMQFYPLWYQLDSNQSYLLWVTDLDSDAKDFVFLDTDDSILAFQTLGSLNDYASRNAITVTDQNPTLYNLDWISQWVDDPSPSTVDCVQMLNAWNMFLISGNRSNTTAEVSARLPNQTASSTINSSTATTFRPSLRTANAMFPTGHLMK